MSIFEYIKDKYKEILLLMLNIIIIILLLLLLLNINTLIIILVLSIIIINYILIFIYNFLKRKIFYDQLKKCLNNLDQKYLITEVIHDPNFIEGKKMLEFLYEINKCMNENVKNYKINNKEFVEYIELWCHEIKTPIATTNLIIDNNSNKITKSIKEELDKISSFVEQVLYYTRSENVEKDYIIKDISLKNVVDQVINKNRKILINKKIKVEIQELCNAKTDSKWIEFIINQIINNSIKYSKEINPMIKISSCENKNNIILFIEDNGIGIKKDELEKVFLKCFTGTNGRLKYNSTGIGLYLCKKLCDKLNHSIEIDSIENIKTIVTIIFPKSNMMELK